MSKGRIHLYGLGVILCVCMVLSENVTQPTVTLAHTKQSPDLTTTITPQTTSNVTEESSTENFTKDYTENSTANPSNLTTVNQGNDSVTATTADGDAVKRISSIDDGTPAVSGHPTTSAVFTITSTIGTSVTPESKKSDSSTVGVVFLILILIIIIALAVLLYILWKKGRTYSFDLSQAGNDHETPLRSMEHGGTFEHTNKELPPLDFGQEDKPHETTPTANGCAAEADKEASPSGHQNVPEEDSYMSETSLTPPPKKVEFSLDLDLIGDDFEMVELPNAEPSNQQQNENNNNVTNSENDSLNIFTEINLGEPQ
ncbi:uncharacterized protein LOC111194097 [Astyanax mexicanus]|uniref:uncharacterized protein LOC111194097 n=1 Tax=Astyanax mexicanus TaxID=7994 RepID=UPI0020CAEA73|nr:uncharacterized protein LOC111194097 [Astyanax mexicanus]